MGIPACSRCRLTASLYDASVVGVGALPPGCPTGVALEIDFEACLCLGDESLKASCSNSFAVSYLRRQPWILLNVFTPGQGVGVCLADCETCDLESLATGVADVLIREAVKPKQTHDSHGIFLMLCHIKSKLSGSELFWIARQRCRIAGQSSSSSMAYLRVTSTRAGLPATDTFGLPGASSQMQQPRQLDI